MRITQRVALSITVTAILTIFLAPISMADPTTRLKSEIDAARSASGCPPFQLDTLLNDVSHNIARNTDEYVRHTSSFMPASPNAPSGDADLMRILRESGSRIVKAKLIEGYGDPNTGGPGDNEAKAIKATVMEGSAFGVFPDCAYTKYGFSAINDDGSQGWPSTAPRQYTVTALVVAAA
jgi:hypothetical protein